MELPILCSHCKTNPLRKKNEGNYKWLIEKEGPRVDQWILAFLGVWTWGDLRKALWDSKGQGTNKKNKGAPCGLEEDGGARGDVWSAPFTAYPFKQCLVIGGLVDSRRTWMWGPIYFTPWCKPCKKLGITFWKWIKPPTICHICFVPFKLVVQHHIIFLWKKLVRNNKDFQLCKNRYTPGGTPSRPRQYVCWPMSFQKLSSASLSTTGACGQEARSPGVGERTYPSRSLLLDP